MCIYERVEAKHDGHATQAATEAATIAAATACVPSVTEPSSLVAFTRRCGSGGRSTREQRGGAEGEGEEEEEEEEEDFDQNRRRV